MSWRAVDVEKLIGEDHPARAIWALAGGPSFAQRRVGSRGKRLVGAVGIEHDPKFLSPMDSRRCNRPRIQLLILLIKLPARVPLAVVSFDPEIAPVDPTERKQERGLVAFLKLTPSGQAERVCGSIESY
jgi:hypothetical protein